MDAKRKQTRISDEFFAKEPTNAETRKEMRRRIIMEAKLQKKKAPLTKLKPKNPDDINKARQALKESMR